MPLNLLIIAVDEEERDDLPCQNCSKCPNVRWHNFPHEGHPLEEDVRDIKESQEPLELSICLMDRACTLAKTSGLGIADVRTVEEGQKIYEDY